MAKYIDAAAFAGGTLTSSESQLRFREMTGQEAYFEFLRMVNDAPAADVAPVVHGRWDDSGRYTFLDGRTAVKCTECGCALTMDEYLLYGWNYCPICGARMDGGLDDA